MGTVAKKPHGSDLLNDMYVLRMISAHPYNLNQNDNEVTSSEDEGDDRSRKADNKWFTNAISNKDLQSMESSAKIMFIFKILSECEKSGEVLLVFSEYRITLNTIEHFLQKDGWRRDVQYYRLDGNTTQKKRVHICKIFGNSEMIENEFQPR